MLYFASLKSLSPAVIVTCILTFCISLATKISAETIDFVTIDGIKFAIGDDIVHGNGGADLITTSAGADMIFSYAAFDVAGSL